MTWKRCGIFVLLSMALGGISVNIGRGDYLGLVASAVLMWLLCHISFGGRIGGREYIPIEIRHGERQVCLTALRDSGNTLRDPITGEQVLVIDSTAAEALTGMTVRELSDPLGSIGKLPGLRLIPYRAVGQPGGMLLAMRCHVSIGRKKGSAVVAFAPQNIGRGEGYRALTGGAIA